MTKLTSATLPEKAEVAAPEVLAQFDILRRIVDRGLSLSTQEDTVFTDIFIHLQDEINRTRKFYEEANGVRYGG